MAHNKMLVMLAKSPWGCEEGRIRVGNTLSGDSVLFVQDAVIGASNPPKDILEIAKAKMAEGVKFYACENDLKARGLTPMEGIKVVSYGDIVDLILESDLTY